MKNLIIFISFLIFTSMAFGAQPKVSSVMGFKIFKIKDNLVYIDSNEIDHRNSKRLVPKFDKILIVDKENSYEGKFLDAVVEIVPKCMGDLERKFWRYKVSGKINAPEIAISNISATIESIDLKKFIAGKLDNDESNLVAKSIAFQTGTNLNEARNKANECIKGEYNSIKKISCFGYESLFVGSKQIDSAAGIELLKIFTIDRKTFYFIKGESNDYPYFKISSEDGELILIKESSMPLSC